MPKLNQLGIAHLLLPLILLIGIIAGVYLVTSGNPLKLFSKASNSPIVFKSLDGKVLPLSSDGIAQASSSAILIEFTSTLGPPPPSEISQVIKLDAGWNAVGLTVDKSNYKAEDFLKELDTQTSPTARVTQVSRMVNGGAQEVHTRGQQANNFDIKPGEGYLIRSTKSGAQATLKGSSATQSSITIPQGHSYFSLVTAPGHLNNAENILQEMKKQGINISQISVYQYGSWQSHLIGNSANNFSLEAGKAYLIRNNGASATFNLSTNIATPSPTASASAAPVTTVSYRFAEDPTTLDTASYVPYTQEPMVVNYTFKDSSPGKKFIWADFKDSTGKIERKSASLNIVAPVSPTPTPNPTTIPTPSPTPSPTPTPVPTSALPDLVVTGISKPNLKVGNWNYIQITIKNQGAAKATGYQKMVELTLKGSNSTTSCDKAAFSDLNTGASASIDLNCISYSSGTNVATATVDSYNNVKESNEDNNQYTTNLYVSPTATPSPIYFQAPSLPKYSGTPGFTITSTNSKTTLSCKRNSLNCHYETKLTAKNSTNVYFHNYGITQLSPSNTLQFRGYDGYMTTSGSTRTSPWLAPNYTTGTFVQVDFPTTNLGIQSFPIYVLFNGRCLRNPPGGFCGSYAPGVWTLNINITQ